MLECKTVALASSDGVCVSLRKLGNDAVQDIAPQRAEQRAIDICRGMEASKRELHSQPGVRVAVSAVPLTLLQVDMPLQH